MCKISWVKTHDTCMEQSTSEAKSCHCFETYSIELGNMGVQTIPDEGIRSSPKNKNPPPCALKQWPTTLRIRPREWSWDTMLDLPFPRPMTPAVEGGVIGPEYFWSYPHLAMHQTNELSNHSRRLIGNLQFKLEAIVSCIIVNPSTMDFEIKINSLRRLWE